MDLAGSFVSDCLTDKGSRSVPWLPSLKGHRRWCRNLARAGNLVRSVYVGLTRYHRAVDARVPNPTTGSDAFDN